MQAVKVLAVAEVQKYLFVQINIFYLHIKVFECLIALFYYETSFSTKYHTYRS